MKYFEFGTEHPELMVMLHGGGTPALLGAMTEGYPEKQTRKNEKERMV